MAERDKKPLSLEELLVSRLAQTAFFGMAPVRRVALCIIITG
jgi:hypothetical protein